jgi:uncharacterized damage-inducible protein DinB
MIDYLSYFDKVRERTMRVVGAIPPGQLDWTCREGQFTLGDLMRHVATTERYVFAENMLGFPSRYPGCGKEFGGSYGEIVALMDRLHRESLEIFSRFSPAEWNQKCATPQGIPITRWKLLRACIEHEVHHRGQIYVYLGILGVPAPSLYGLNESELRALSASSTPS